MCLYSTMFTRARKRFDVIIPRTSSGSHHLQQSITHKLHNKSIASYIFFFSATITPLGQVLCCLLLMLRRLQSEEFFAQNKKRLLQS